MKRTTLEWIEKAEEDFVVAEWVAKAPVGSPAAVGFHCQQCIEKYIKSILAEQGIAFPRTHDLLALVALLPEATRCVVKGHHGLDLLQPYAINSRYPGFTASPADAVEALDACRELRKLLRETLALP